jgi:hypothetical protein
MRVLFSFVLLALAGCATAPTQQEKALADYGSPPSNYEKSIRDYLQVALKDPYSYDMKILFEPRKDWTAFFSKKTFGYAVCANINAKNSFGGYNGFKLVYFLIRNDQVVESSGLGQGEEILATQQCSPDKRAP